MTNQSKAPWETYGESLVGKDSPELAAEVEAYSKRRHDTSSSQNQELLAEWKEGNQLLAKQYQWLKPEEYEYVGPRIGRVLSYGDFINELRDKLHIHCWYREMGHPQKLALWAQRDGMRPPESVCFVQYPFMPELSIMRFDDKGVPLDEKMRGWRTVLMRLVQKQFTGEHRVRKIYGDANNYAGGRYNQFMKDMRSL